MNDEIEPGERPAENDTFDEEGAELTEENADFDAEEQNPKEVPNQ